MEINRVDPSFPLRPRRTFDGLDPTSPSELPGDSVSISPQARLRQQLQGAPEIRAERVAEIRRRIESGTYDVDRLLGAALDRILDDLR
ncbi:MAG: flagellar biosynthesis anti-sigma factor FlgM [Planctomycetia bacterium]|nr:flagellar biosynthesis anti-sigma factor FlgM [Planctomycetia bacterium]